MNMLNLVYTIKIHKGSLKLTLSANLTYSTHVWKNISYKTQQNHIVWCAFVYSLSKNKVIWRTWIRAEKKGQQIKRLCSCYLKVEDLDNQAVKKNVIIQIINKHAELILNITVISVPIYGR